MRLPLTTKTQKLLFWMAVGLFMILLLNVWNMPPPALDEQVIFSDFMSKIETGDMEKVTIRGHHISGVLKNNSRLRTYSTDYPELVQVLREKNVQIEVKPPEENPWYISLLSRFCNLLN